MQLLMALVTFLVALIGAMSGLFLLLPLGLVVHELVIFPLALAIAALLAAIAANWAGSGLARDETRTRLLPVVGATEGVALVALLVVIANFALRLAIFNRIMIIAVFCGLMLALGATVATWRFRRSKESPSSDGLLTLALLGLAVVAVPVVIFVASLFGLTGA